MVGLGRLGIAIAVAVSVVIPGVAHAATASSVAPYVDMGEWPTPVLSTMASRGGVKSFTLGFVTAFGCKASWMGAYDPRAGWQKAEIAKVRAAGGDVKVSFGGASGIELAQMCGTVTSLANEYDAVVKAYSLKDIDLDIEGAAVADPVSITRRSQALAVVAGRNPGLKISLTLPVMPDGLDANGLTVVKAAKAANVPLDMVNVMAMDYYEGRADQGAKAIAAAKATQKQLKSLYGLSDAAAWKKVGVTPMLGVNDSGDEIFYQKDARALVAFAQSVHLGMLSYWEQGRDANACTGDLAVCNNIPQQPYEFAKIFSAYNG
ncbi:chitinase [Actinocrispum sp. NPDC049592]|uniref:chitinase n=1 Tax=Actinocrispum sp. NPDC049592 TaxID=3154835 RepID=UPI003420FFC2